MSWVLPWGSVLVIERVCAPKLKSCKLLLCFCLGDCDLLYFFNTCVYFVIYILLDLGKVQVLQTPVNLTPIIWKEAYWSRAKQHKLSS